MSVLLHPPVEASPPDIFLSRMLTSSSGFSRMTHAFWFFSQSRGNCCRAPCRNAIRRTCAMIHAISAPSDKSSTISNILMVRVAGKKESTSALSL